MAGGDNMGKLNFIGKWNRSSELFRTEQFILTFAKEEDLIKIEEVIKQRREELAKKESKY
jgi:small-conductance mechanosensitive channel